MLDAKAQSMLDYWFGNLDHTPAYFQERNRLWFMGGEKVDEEIKERFGKEVDAAAAGLLGSWERSPKGLLALVVALDQFSLNIHRNGARGYADSDLALPLARKAIARGWDLVLSPAERVFLYLPFEHSESLGDQETAVRLFSRLAAEAPAELKDAMNGSLDYALRHYRVIQRFGRFPHRNAALGRESTPEEKAFLASSEAPF